MRRRKLSVTLLLAFIVALNASSLGWAIVTHGTQSIVTGDFGIIFSTYLLILAVYSINQEDVRLHTESILHITALSTIATSLFFASIILPDTTAVTTNVIEELRGDVPMGLWYATLVLYAIVSAISITTPLGPKLHFPPERIYSERTVSAITNKDEENVCGDVYILET